MVLSRFLYKSHHGKHTKTEAPGQKGPGENDAKDRHEDPNTNRCQSPSAKDSDCPGHSQSPYKKDAGQKHGNRNKNT